MPVVWSRLAAGGWAMAGVQRGGCGRRTSVRQALPSGRTRMPLTVWCAAYGLFAPATDGISALGACGGL